MNPAERLWRAIAARDWDAVRAQLAIGARIEWPHTGETLDAEDYVAAHRARPADRPVEVLRATGDGELFAVEARVGDAVCAGFYDMHAGHIQAITEYWIGNVG
jgi:hypothetical protein